MKVKFKWAKVASDYRPVCESDALYKDGFSLLDRVLMDDGGVGFMQSIHWLNEALENIEAIKANRIDSYDWLCEAWGAELDKNNAKIYSALQEDYYQIFDLEVFEKVLRAWLIFIQGGTKEEIEYSFEYGVDFKKT